MTAISFPSGVFRVCSITLVHLPLIPDNVIADNFAWSSV
jgi:hypothetical protein